MNPSPLFFSMTFVASISVLTAGVAWSAYEAQAKQAELSSSKARAVKARTPKPKQTFAKPVGSSLETGKVNLTSTLQLSTPQPPVTPAVNSSAMPQYVSAASSEIANNPYFANQPAAILPLAARPAAMNPTPKPAVAPAIAPVIAPVVSIPVPAVAAASAEPVKAVPPVAAAIPATAAAPVVAALPSLEPPIYGAPAAAPVAANSYKEPVAAYQPWNSASAGNRGASTNPYLNPYLNYRSYQPQPLAAPAPVQPFTQPFNPFGSGNFKFSMPSLPSLPSFPSLPQAGNPESAAYQPALFNTQQAAASSTGVVSSLFSNLKMMIPLTGDANILPTIKKVYPTGEKPLVVLNFKCPTEVVGITPPPMKLLHEAVNFGFDGLNKTNLLSFNLQQVCS